jgi:hypothetical protein
VHVVNLRPLFSCERYSKTFVYPGMVCRTTDSYVLQVRYGPRDDQSVWSSVKLSARFCCWHRRWCLQQSLVVQHFDLPWLGLLNCGETTCLLPSPSAVTQISFGLFKFCLSLNEVNCFCFLWNETSSSVTWCILCAQSVCVLLKVIFYASYAF